MCVALDVEYGNSTYGLSIIWVILPHDTLQSREGALVIICVLASPYRKDDNGVGIIIPLQKGGLSYEKGTVSQT